MIHPTLSMSLRTFSLFHVNLWLCLYNVGSVNRVFLVIKAPQCIKLPIWPSAPQIGPVSKSTSYLPASPKPQPLTRPCYSEGERNFLASHVLLNVSTVTLIVLILIKVTKSSPHDSVFMLHIWRSLYEVIAQTLDIIKCRILILLADRLQAMTFSHVYKYNQNLGRPPSQHQQCCHIPIPLQL